MPPVKPSLELLRALTDGHVLDRLMGEQQLTRAELAARTGISKPTISESVRRLVAGGLLYDTGLRTTGRGGVGSYFALAPAAGCALAAGVGPDGAVAEMVGPHGEVLARAEETIGHPALSGQVAKALRRACRRAARGAVGPLRLALVSAADPVDRRSGRTVQLPDAPFLVGELWPSAVLAGLVDGPVRVDNDVNWAALAERDASPGLGDDFAYLYLGEGLGCAVVSDGEVRRGHSGLAGEIAHVQTVGPRGQSMPFTAVFGALGLRRPGTTAIDVEEARRAVSGEAPRSARLRSAIARSTCGVLAALVAVCDPQAVVVGGPWGTEPRLLDEIGDRLSREPRQVRICAAQVTVQPWLAGARQQAVRELRQAIMAQWAAGDGGAGG